MRALEKFPADPLKSCVSNQRVGVNVLKRIVPELSEKSGVGKRYTNHSLRATAITRMFNSGIPEKVIAEASGHRSTKALRCYERTSQQQKQAVTKVINSSECVQTKQEMEYCEKENCESKVAIPLEEKQSVTPQSFSGNFSNCTINISLK